VTVNWAGNLTFSAARLAHPASVDEVRAVVREADSAHVLGAGHSFSAVADTTGTLVSLDGMPELFEVGGSTARVGAGMRLARLAELLHARGLALPALPSLPHITVAGAVATATHGSGDAVSSLADLVHGLELVTASGEVVTPRRGDPDFDGAVVSLGGLGVVTAVELAVCPAFEVEQRVYDDVPFDVLVPRFADVFGSAYSVSAFTTWRGTAHVWVKRRVDDAPADLGWAGGRAADGPRHPVPGQPALHCTAQLGEPGPWHERLPHFRADFTPSVGQELQSEYFVGREHAGEALRAIEALRIGDVLLTSEIRTVDADAQWLSPVHGRPSVAFHFTWRQDEPAVRAELARVEAALEPWDPRPHWGKLTNLTPATVRYPAADRFTDLRARLDPTGKFRNAVLDTWFPDQG
jgi:alditol oxidase